MLDEGIEKFPTPSRGGFDHLMWVLSYLFH
jgi:hypothetical protein